MLGLPSQKGTFWTGVFKKFVAKLKLNSLDTAPVNFCCGIWFYFLLPMARYNAAIYEGARVKDCWTLMYAKVCKLIM